MFWIILRDPSSACKCKEEEEKGDRIADQKSYKRGENPLFELAILSTVTSHTGYSNPHAFLPGEIREAGLGKLEHFIELFKTITCFLLVHYIV